MLMVSGQTGMKRPTEGWDRGRVRERLHAALAGLQELQVLRDKQQTLVNGALAMKPAAPPPPPPPVPRAPRLPQQLPSTVPAGDSHSKEHRLEATLTALKEQLSRLRRQDVGLKTHLDQLDQQISELKLDVNKTSSENLDSDSRPSSGFYDLSDGGSCSLSNSCTSVYSESISSSHSSLLPGIHTPKVRLSIFDYRPKSADETTVHSAHLQPQQLVSENCWIKGSPENEAETVPKFKPRPVSTGDLERIVPTDGSLQKTTNDPKNMSPLCYGTEILFHEVDPKYQSDLVSKSGSDRYPYPSPLHAVALQSPLFSLTRETLETDNHLPLTKPILSMSGPSLIRTKPITEVPPPGGYIDKLLQLTRDRGKYTSGSVSEWESAKGQMPLSQKKLGGLRVNSSSQVEKQVSSPESRQAKTGRVQREVPDENSTKLQESGEPSLEGEQPASQQSLESMVTNSCFPGKVSPISAHEEPEVISLEQESSSCSQVHQSHLNMAPQRSNTKVILPPKKVGKKGTTLVTGEFVHAQFVPGEAHLMRLKASNLKTKALKVKRRSSDKVLRLGKQQPVLAERPRGMHATSRLSTEWNPFPRSHGGKNLLRRTAFVGEVTGRSCSESSLFPVPFHIPAVVSRPELYPSSAHPLYSLEATQLNLVANGGAKKKQQRKWQSTVEISAKSHLASFPADTGLALPRPPGRRAGILRTMSGRSRPKLPNHNAYAKSESDHSEYSAECASLFHSTIVETSEDDVSDYTANCFGDSESEDSDSEGACRSSESSLTLDYEEAVGSELIWPKAIVQQPVKVQPALKSSHHSVPKICRIKASKALKKKIRRFQPASLKVMTMV
ncbi:dapper homolog 2 [Sarcophilus harrisii]|uniref:Dishevelled binding antagonist of beta catenin 2 n=1 Tax=Sarcophilus harrisii TaxID=9305 RepID=A0A7N4NY91_SARHA|nr:dapper homolog 2 [Sarcophilus harrisii]